MDLSNYVFLISSYIAVLVHYTDGIKHKNLTIGVIYPNSGSWAGGQGCIPAIEMALDDLNNNTEVLTDYRLNMEFNDSQVRHTRIQVEV